MIQNTEPPLCKGQPMHPLPGAFTAETSEVPLQTLVDVLILPIGLAVVCQANSIVADEIVRT